MSTIFVLKNILKTRRRIFPQYQVGHFFVTNCNHQSIMLSHCRILIVSQRELYEVTCQIIVHKI
uniref:Uncharacterized protein n=1 Tax=Anguilla anguilla TaxID=7936 RepID=A0A0E9TTD8_ANGAN